MNSARASEFGIRGSQKPNQSPFCESQNPNPETRPINLQLLTSVLAFLDCDELVGVDAAHAFHESAGPAHFNLIDLPRRAQPKVLAKVALRNVAGAAPDFTNLAAVSRCDGHA